MFNIFKKAKPVQNGPDFSGVDSVDKARDLAARGELERMMLLPEAFGGDDAPHNVVYVPIGFSDIKAGTDTNVVLPLATQGKVKSYTASPHYSGVSHVPVAVQIVASDPGHFSVLLRIWGEGLDEAYQPK